MPEANLFDGHEDRLIAAVEAEREKERQAKRKAAAEEQARALAVSLLPVFDGERTLDDTLAAAPAVLADRRPSIQHIMAVFGAAERWTKRELVYYLVYPHVLATIP